jgi:L-threonylcarbamoyladenylate synthase
MKTRDMRAALTAAGLEEIRGVIERAGVMAMPTETYYALGASPFQEAAVERVVRLKGRPEGMPILVLVAEQSDVGRFVIEIPPIAELLMNRFWPGPLTLVLPAQSSLPTLLTAGSGTVGIRQPSHAGLRMLLGTVGPLTGTSANRSGSPPAQSAKAVQDHLGEAVDIIVDGGRTEGGLPSTVVSVMGQVSVLREGRISRQAIAFALKDRGAEWGG